MGWHGSDSSGTNKPCNGACRTQVQYLHTPPRASNPAHCTSGVCLLSRQNNPPRHSRFQLPPPAPVLAFHLPQLQPSTPTTAAAAPLLAAASTFDTRIRRVARQIRSACPCSVQPPGASALRTDKQSPDTRRANLHPLTATQLPPIAIVDSLQLQHRVRRVAEHCDGVRRRYQISFAHS